MPEKPFRVSIHWGSGAEFEDEEPVEYEFGTDAEREAFLLGISEMDGWAGYDIVSVEPEDSRDLEQHVHSR